MAGGRDEWNGVTCAGTSGSCARDRAAGQVAGREDGGTSLCGTGHEYVASRAGRGYGEAVQTTWSFRATRSSSSFEITAAQGETAALKNTLVDQKLCKT